MGTEGPRTSPQGDVRYAIRVTAGYAWRLIVIAVAVALLLTVVGFGVAFTFIVNSVAGQSAMLATQFSGGLNDMERLLAGSPFHIPPIDLASLGQQSRDWVTHNGGSLAEQALGGAGVAIEALSCASRWHSHWRY